MDATSIDQRCADWFILCSFGISAPQVHGLYSVIPTHFISIETKIDARLRERMDAEWFIQRMEASWSRKRALSWWCVIIAMIPLYWIVLRTENLSVHCVTRLLRSSIETTRHYLMTLWLMLIFLRNYFGNGWNHLETWFTNTEGSTGGHWVWHFRDSESKNERWGLKSGIEDPVHNARWPPHYRGSGF